MAKKESNGVIIFELTGTENSPIYQALEVSNGNRHYDFLLSSISIALQANIPMLSEQIIKALNFHAIACLHTNAGEYRPCPVTVGDYRPPEHYQVNARMEHFVNIINRSWNDYDSITLSALVLWNLNFIHPFINGNGRTARAAAYFVLCTKAGGLIKGQPILPELLRLNRARYVDALKKVDQSLGSGDLDVGPLAQLISELLQQQIDSAESPEGLGRT